MLNRTIARSAQRLTAPSRTLWPRVCQQCAIRNHSSFTTTITSPSQVISRAAVNRSSFHTTSYRPAQSPTADALMEDLNELYATAKDEFEIAAEETEKKTVYAQDDRDAAREALTVLQDTYAKSLKESDPEVAKEVEKRCGHRIRELEHAVIAMEESAMED